MARKRIVGTNTLGYPEIRNIVSLPFSRYKVVKKQNVFKLFSWLYFKSFSRTHEYYWNSFRDFNLNKVDLFHFFNTVSFGSKPWITTFETNLPRWGNISTSKTKIGMQLLAGKSCKKLIALSQCTHDIQKHLIESKFPELADEILAKLTVLHPPQNPNITKYKEKYLSDETIALTLVGADFFRKGGKEILKAMDHLLSKKLPFKLNIISSLNYGDYASQSSKSDLNFAREIIAKYPQHILYYNTLPNQEVLKIFNETDIGLLPSYADTYGYTVLEAQASGCPVISTDIRTLPEINHNDVGWLIKVSKKENGDAKISSEKERKRFSKQVLDQLISILEKAADDRSTIIRKGKNSLERISQFHNPVRNAYFLEDIYDDALL